MARRRRFREHPKCLSEEHLQSWRSRLHPGNEQGPGEPSAPPCLPFHAPRFAAGQRLGCHTGWSWPRIPSSAAARHSQILQPSLVHTGRCRWQGRRAPAAHRQPWDRGGWKRRARSPWWGCSAGEARTEPPISGALGGPVPPAEVWRSPLAPQRRNQKILHVRNASYHLGQFLQFS